MGQQPLVDNGQDLAGGKVLFRFNDAAEQVVFRVESVRDEMYVVSKRYVNILPDCLHRQGLSCYEWLYTRLAGPILPAFAV